MAQLYFGFICTLYVVQMLFVCFGWQSLAIIYWWHLAWGSNEIPHHGQVDF
jgi:hypothetical protein